jgi:hypothetical protein
MRLLLKKCCPYILLLAGEATLLSSISSFRTCRYYRVVVTAGGEEGPSRQDGCCVRSYSLQYHMYIQYFRTCSAECGAACVTCVGPEGCFV